MLLKNYFQQNKYQFKKALSSICNVQITKIKYLRNNNPGQPADNVEHGIKSEE